MMRRAAAGEVALACATPAAWYDRARTELPTLLIDHANCEKKAAGTALSLLYRYVDKPDLLKRMSRLAREELRHYEQVLAMMDSLGLQYRALTPGRYAGTLRAHMRTAEPGRLVDTLIVGAVVEARSCERFSGLAARFDGELARFYGRLAAAEARHANVYLEMARGYERARALPSNESVSFDMRLDEFVGLDRDLVSSDDPEFRFHSGVPARTAAT